MKRTTQIATITLLALAGVAHAGPDEKKQDSEKQLLRGPRVQQNAPDAEKRERPRDGMQMQDNERRQGERGQRTGAQGGEFREMLGAMRALKRAEGDLALTEDQEKQIKAIAETHRSAMKAYMEEHKEEIEAIRASVKGADGERPDPEQRKAAMEKIRKIMEGSPADGSAKKAIMGVLSEGQQGLVKETVKKQRERLKERQSRMGERGEEARKRRGAEQDADAPRDGQRRQRMQRTQEQQKTRKGREGDKPARSAPVDG